MANQVFGVDYAVRSIRKSGEKFDASALCNASFRPILERSSACNTKHFGIVGKPLVIMEYLHETVKTLGQVTVSDQKYKMIVSAPAEEVDEEATSQFQVELHEVEANEKYVVSVCQKTISNSPKLNEFNSFYTTLKDRVVNIDQN